jgi:glycosyltransferase involved in cell wall biosynthesis
MRHVWPEITDLADVVIAPSESVRQIMIAFGVRAPLRVIENGIELELFLHPRRPRAKADFGLPDAVILFVYVGRLAAEKALPVLVRQFALARGRSPRLHLALIGKGPQEDELRRLAGQLGQGEAIHFCGGVPFDEVADWLAAADAFATASTSEVHPLTVIEAMAAGKPIVAVRSPGIADVVESGVSGYLAAAPDELSRAIEALVNDLPRARAMGAAARDIARRFDIRRTVAETVSLYEELLATRPDLWRARAHGRWSRRTEQWHGVFDQLTHLRRPAGESMRDE